jgi:hypothetical protein
MRLVLLSTGLSSPVPHQEPRVQPSILLDSGSGAYKDSANRYKSCFFSQLAKKSLWICFRLADELTSQAGLASGAESLQPGRYPVTAN